ncbi:DUF6118 family protein [Paenirhodobacter sp.]|uniref:DUF6118 family protein n=1 Tax=Paenirhodobacter sp. TaxID=1965326 RepID=UPI003B505669
MTLTSATLIQTGDPGQYQRVFRAEWVFAHNSEALKKCVTDMQESKQDQRCTVSVPAPAHKAPAGFVMPPVSRCL